ncbi:MAG: hypothetical protein R3D02_03725 [Hyphomicrobiales bacterium]
MSATVRQAEMGEPLVTMAMRRAQVAQLVVIGGDIHPTGKPLDISTLLLVAGLRPLIVRNSVDLPEPTGPSGRRSRRPRYRASNRG